MTLTGSRPKHISAGFPLLLVMLAVLTGCARPGLSIIPPPVKA